MFLMCVKLSQPLSSSMTCCWFSKWTGYSQAKNKFEWSTCDSLKRLWLFPSVICHHWKTKISFICWRNDQETSNASLKNHSLCTLGNCSELSRLEGKLLGNYIVKNGLEAHSSNVCKVIFHCHKDSKAVLGIKPQTEALDYLFHIPSMNPGTEGNENPCHSVIQHKQTNPQLHCRY